jgi:hypothetical protein
VSRFRDGAATDFDERLRLRDVCVPILFVHLVAGILTAPNARPQLPRACLQKLRDKKGCLFREQPTQILTLIYLSRIYLLSDGACRLPNQRGAPVLPCADGFL